MSGRLMTFPHVAALARTGGRRSRLWLALWAAIAAAGLGTVVAPGGASAASPAYGVVPQDGALPPAEDLDLMRQGGVDSIRMMAHGGTAEPIPGQFDWGTLDAVVRETTARGIQPLLFFYGPPEWAARHDGRECAADACAAFAPRSPETRAAYANFAREAVERYGPGGDFWPQDPSDPAASPTNPPCGCTVASPIRVWQVWNEQNSPKYFAPKVNVKSYAKLVRSAGKAIKSADPAAEVMLGGMWGPGSLKQRPKGKGAKVKKPPVTIFTEFMDRLYQRKWAKRTFDSLAIHPYSASVSGMVKQLREARRVAKRAGDRKVGIWITEIGWASGGPTSEPYYKGFEGQAERLTRAYERLEQQRRAFRLRGVFWYSWRDRPGGDQICAWCGHAGLINVDGSAKPAWDAFVAMAGG